MLSHTKHRAISVIKLNNFRGGVTAQTTLLLPPNLTKPDFASTKAHFYGQDIHICLNYGRITALFYFASTKAHFYGQVNIRDVCFLSKFIFFLELDISFVLSNE